MADIKTQPNNLSIDDFLHKVEPAWKRDDSKKIMQLLQKITGEKPVMWGETIIGFGNYHYKYKSGREIDYFLAGFSPRKANITVYMMGGFEGHDEDLAKLGKYKKSVGCLYFKKLEDIDIEVLERMTIRSIETLKKRYADYN